MTATDTVTLSRSEYEALLSRLEDAEDENTIKRFDARVAEVGFEAATKDYLPAAMVWRMMDGEHPVKIWREHRALTGAALARLSGVPQSYISDIETLKKPGSVAAFSKLAHALALQIDDLVPAADL